MKIFLLFICVFELAMPVVAERVALTNLSDTNTHQSFGRLAQYRDLPASPEQLNVTQRAFKSLLTALKPAIKNLTNYTGIFSGNCSVFFGKSIESAACDIAPAETRTLQPTAKFLPEKHLPREYWHQVTSSHILLATVFADWVKGMVQEYSLDLYFRQGTCSDTISETTTQTATLALPTPVPLTPYPPTDYPPTSYPPTAYPPTPYPPTDYPPTSYPPTDYPPTPYPPTDYPPTSYPPTDYPPTPYPPTAYPPTSYPPTPYPPTDYPPTSYPPTPYPPTPAPIPPSAGLLAAWSQTGGTYADGTSQVSRYTVSPAGVVNDALTGIQWEQTASSSPMTWSAASSYCSGQTTGGLSGWRLPNIGELQTLVDYTVDYTIAVPMNAAAFPTPPVADLWASTSKVGVSANAWNVYFSNTGYSYYATTGTSKKVRCIRSSYSPPPTSRYTVVSGEVTDTVTGLIWQKVSTGGTMGQTAAVSHCLGLTLNGNSDWRLPTIKELSTLIDYSVSQGSLMMGSAFTGEPANWYWSSTALAGGPSSAWYAHFGHGGLFSLSVGGNCYVRCVR